MAIPRNYILGHPVDSFDKDSLLEFIEERLSRHEKTVIANLNVHALHCINNSSAMADLFRRPETFVHIDGMPIVWLLRATGAYVTRENRLTYLDWACDLLAKAETRNWKVGYIGSTPEICSHGINHFVDLHPRIVIRGWDGFFDMDDGRPDSKLQTMLREIDSFAPDILIVGMGMPRQERFLQENFDRLTFGVACCSGAFFEYFVGGQPRPPRWVGKLGFEWLYRLVFNPSRYAKRYLIEPWQLLYVLARKSFSRTNDKRQR